MSASTVFTLSAWSCFTCAVFSARMRATSAAACERMLPTA
jgi:hypothetical protein